MASPDPACRALAPVTAAAAPPGSGRLAALGSRKAALAGWAGLLFGLALLLVAGLPPLALGIAALAVAGAARAASGAAVATLLQLTAPDVLRGRVMALHTIALVGLSSFGGALAGVVAQAAGAPAAVAWGAVAVVLIVPPLAWIAHRAAPAG